MQGHALVPLMYVVWVLAQQDTVQQQGPPADELLKAGQPQLQVHVVWGPQGGRDSERASMHSLCHLPALGQVLWPSRPTPLSTLHSLLLAPT